jgi:hypothetical protein
MQLSPSWGALFGETDRSVVKDRPVAMLSTAIAKKIGTQAQKLCKKVFVKPVNRTSSGNIARLSHFSVDKPV